MLQKMIEERNLSPFLSKAEMLDILQAEEYGYLPPKPEAIRFELISEDEIFCAGKAPLKKILAHTVINGKAFSFPFSTVIPVGTGPFPVIIHINFRDTVPDKYMYTEEIIDNGFAVLSFCYEDVTTDSDDMTDGLAGILFENGERENTDAGKIAMWAWAAHRVMDYAVTLPELDITKSVVCGHSRLGKTALLAAATDERFMMSYSNESGCSGAALYNEAVGETIDDIIRRFPFWFCKNYLKYKGMDNNMPFDQHFLTACIYPRRIYIASAAENEWADPTSEFLNCVAVSQIYESNGMKGFVHSNRLPNVGEKFHEGNVAYHMREGLHYFSREDWLYMMEYMHKYMQGDKI